MHIYHVYYMDQTCQTPKQTGYAYDQDGLENLKKYVPLLDGQGRKIWQSARRDPQRFPVLYNLETYLYLYNYLLLKARVPGGLFQSNGL